MPRIAAAIGVFSLIAAFTYINIRTYPAVWEMVGPAPLGSQAAESSPREIPVQPEMVAEKEIEQPAVPPKPELKSLAESEKNSASKIDLQPMGLGPRYGSKQELERSSNADSLPPLETDNTAVYRGLNMGPIKIPATTPETAEAAKVVVNKPVVQEKATKNAGSESPLKDRGVAHQSSEVGGSQWPAEMSPRMKYAAGPPVLESYQIWNPERPVVPVKRDGKTETAGGDEQDKSPKETKKPAAADTEDTSCLITPLRALTCSNKPAVTRLPPVEPKNRPIRMSISAQSPIPIYPDTGR